MTIAEQLRTEGWQEGRQEGENQKTHQIAVGMLVKGYPVTDISELTGLPLEAVKNLKAQTEH